MVKWFVLAGLGAAVILGIMWYRKQGSAAIASVAPQAGAAPPPAGVVPALAGNVNWHPPFVGSTWAMSAKAQASTPQQSTGMASQTVSAH